MKKQTTFFTLSDRNHILILLIAGLLVYINTLGHGFALDDVAVVTRNRFVQKGISGIPEIFTSFYWQGFWNQNTGLYRPLSVIMFALEWQFLPETPFLHHLINITFYLVSLALAYRLLRRLIPQYNPLIPLVTVLLFAVHPLHTEVVANIKSRDEIMSLFFLLLTALLLADDSKKGIVPVLLLFLFNTCSLLSKEAAITAIPVYIVMLMTFRQKTLWESIIRTAPVILSGIAWLAWRYYVTHFMAPPIMPYTYQDNSTVGCASEAERIATGIAMFGTYIIKCFWPYSLSYDYSYNEIPCESFSSFSTLSALALIMASLTLMWRLRKSQPVISFGIFFFFCSMAVSSNIFFPIGTTMGERLLCTPLLGFELALVTALFKYADPAKTKTGIIFSGLLSVCFAGMSISRNRDWKNDYTIYVSDVDAAPNSSRVHYNYATAKMGALPEKEPARTQALDDIISHFERSLAIDPKEYNAYVNIGTMYYKRKRYPESITATRKAIEINPGDTILRANLADAYFMNRQYDSAIVYYLPVIIHPNAQANHFNVLGSAYFSVQRLNEAKNTFKTGLQRFPDHSEMWLNYGNVLGASGQLEEAIRAFEQSYLLNPGNKQPLYFIAMTYERMGNRQKAGEYMDRYNK